MEEPPHADRPLAIALAEAGPAELVERLRAAGGELDAGLARLAVANPHAGREAVELLLARNDLLTSYELRRDLAACPATPRPAALRLLSTLYWRDLADLARDVQVAPALRIAADRQLLARLPGLALGERLTLARRAGPEVAAALALDPNPRVMAALLENPRLTEGALVPILARDRIAPEALRAVAENSSWGVRYPVRRALVRNPRTPVETSLRLLATLPRSDLAAIAADVRLTPALRQRAQRLSV